jgi:hypothetical protein
LGVTPFSLTFSNRLAYGSKSGITLPILLTSKVAVAPEAKVDTGSDFCVFNRVYADLLDLKLETGRSQRIRTAAGSFLAYGHEVKISVKDLEWDATVYFAEPADFPVNVVGRSGFLDHLRLGLIDYDRIIYLSDYNS